MALFDFLKRKDEAEKARASKIENKAQKSVKKTSDTKKTEKKVSVKPQKTEESKIIKSKKVSEFSYEAVRQPHISEKASYLAERDQYVFDVSKNYNKNEIKKTIEGIYGVNVLSVNKIKIPAKKMRLGKTQGFKKGYTKAIVKIKKGQKIEIL